MLKSLIIFFLLTYYSVQYPQSGLWSLCFSADNVNGLKYDSVGNIYAFNTASPNWFINSSSDNGISWQTRNNLTLMRFEVSHNGTLFYSGPGSTTSRSTDYGTTWNSVSGLFFSEVPPRYLSFENSKSYFIQLWYKDRTTGPSQLMHSIDQGLTWSQSHYSSGSFTDIDLKSVCFSGDSLIFTASLNKIFVSSNSGNNFSSISEFPVTNLLTLYGSKTNGEVSAIGSNGFFNSTQSGSNWQLRNTGLPVDCTIKSFAFSHNGFIYALTDSGLYKSQNRGITWFNCGNLKQVDKFAINDSSYIIALSNNSIYISKDNGSTWFLATSNLNLLDLYSFLITSRGFAFILDKGRVYRSVTSLSNVTNVLDPVLNPDFVLEQNYPNPFNPVTKIKYKIPVNQYISLKVYDILGKEISVLVNEYLKAGIYEIDFNASFLSGGVYFYKLTAGELTSVMKMIYLK